MQKEKQEIELDAYNNGLDDQVRKKVDLLWEQLIDSVSSQEEMDKIFDEIMGRIEEQDKDFSKEKHR